jgi:hypothetical protein
MSTWRWHTPTQSWRSSHWRSASELAERPRPAALELLQHPPRRRAVVRRLPRAAHIPPVPEDGGRADEAAILAAADRPRRARLAEPPRPRRRRARGALHPPAAGARREDRDDRRRLPQGAEPDPGSGEAPEARRRPHRPRDVACARRGREGRRVRRAPRAQRGGREVGRGAVLHAAAAHPRDRRGDATGAGDADLRSRLWNGRLPPRRARVDSGQPSARPRPEATPSGSRHSGAGRSWTTRHGCA